MNTLRLAVRRLRQSPGLALVVVLTLGLGVGANTAIFSLLNELLLRPLPVKDAKRLLALVLIGPDGDSAHQRIPYPIYQDYLEQNRVFSQMLACAQVHSPVEIGEQRRSDLLQLVSVNFLSALGATAQRGRLLFPEDDQSAGQSPVAVLSHRAWVEWFAGDPAVIGATVVLRPNYVQPLVCTIVGVTSAEFVGLGAQAPALWLPAVMEEHFKRSQSVDFQLTGLLLPGVTRQQATLDLDRAARDIAEKHRGAVIPGYGSEGIFRSDLRTDLRAAARGRWGPFRPRQALRQSITLAFTAAGLVLLIVCANLSNLLIARAAARRKEMAIRWALGASRRRLLAQILADTLLLALLGGAASLLVAGWTNRWLLANKPADLAFIVPTALDYRVALFALGATGLAGLICCLAPAWQVARRDGNEILKGVGSDGSRPGVRLRDVLVSAQIALCLPLLVSAGLCLRSLGELNRADPGFNTSNILLAPVDLPDASGKSADAFFAEAARRLESVPGVRSVSFARSFPLLAGNLWSVPVDRIEGYTPRKDEFLRLEFTQVGAGYFETLGIPVLERSDFDLQDGGELIWINESFARRYWPGQAPLGKRFGHFLVHGVVRDCQIRNLTDPPGPYFYLQTRRPGGAPVVLILRTEGPAQAVLGAVRQELRRLRPELDLSRIQTLRQSLRGSYASQRFLGLLLGSSALVALLLAGLGIYGLMSYLVTLRTREIGMRMALGAQAREVRWLFFIHGARLTGAGLLVGCAGALGAGHVLARFLYATAPLDPLTFGLVPVLLAAAVGLACWWPARRATRVDPMQALRCE
jgi:predicted permease